MDDLDVAYVTLMIALLLFVLYLTTVPYEVIASWL